MRGKALFEKAEPQAEGITPAYAGKRYKRIDFLLCQQDHPRLCGEKVQIHIGIIAVQGSPPPMRGKGQSHFPPEFLSRITPAYAGKSFQTSYFIPPN